MYNNVSDLFKTTIRSPSRTFTCRIKIDGKWIAAGLKKMSYETSSTSEESLQIGSAVAAKVELTIRKIDKLFENTEIQVEIGLKLPSGEYEYVPLGFFTAEHPKTGIDTTTFTAYDRMMKTTGVFVSNLTYPVNAAAVMNEISSECGVSCDTTGLEGITVDTKPVGYTYREMIGYLASLAGKFACVDRNGIIVFKWYSDSGFTVDKSRLISFEQDESDYHLDILTCNGYNATSIVAGSGTLGIAFDNPFMTQDRLNAVYNELKNFSYRGISFKSLGDIRLDPWDIVTVIYNDTDYKVPVMNIVMEYDGGLSMKVTSYGKNETETSTDYKGPSSKTAERTYAELMLAKEMIAKKVDAEWVLANTVTADELEATNAIVRNLEANALTADSALIKSLQTDKLNTNDLNAENAKLGYLAADSVVIADLKSGIADINTLIFGSATGGTIQTEFANSVIAQLGEAQIKSAMIESVSAGKITTGTIYTDDVTIRSKSGNMILSDNTIQISDGTNVRVQIGKDASNNYSINIWDSDGHLMFSQGGITDSAIKSAIIRNDMVSETANISASKLNINSLFTVINEDNSHTLKSTKIYIDDEGQTLDVVFRELSNSVTEQGETISSQGTSIETIQGQITSKIWQQDIITATTPLESGITTLNTQYSSLSQDLNGFKTEVSQTYATTSSVNEVANDLTANYSTTSQMNSIISQSASNVLVTVSGLYATKDSVNNIQVDNSNLIARKNSVVGWIDSSGNLNNGEDWDKTFRTTDYISVNPREEYTVQYWWQSNSFGQAWFLYSYYDSNKNFITVNPSEVYSGYDCYYTAKITIPDGASYVRITWTDLNDYKIKLEKGDKKTDWCPAYADVETSIEIGGRNLLQSKYIVNYAGTTDKSEFLTKGKVIQSDSKAYGGYRIDSAGYYIPSTEYVLSGYITITSKSCTNFTILNAKNHIFIDFRIDDVHYQSPFSRVTEANDVLNDGNRHYFELKFKTNSTIPDDTGNNYTFIQLNQGDEISITYVIEGFNLKKGNIATDWSPALEDMATNVSVEAKLELKIDIDDNDRIVSMVNASAGEINLKANRFSLESTNATITKTGVVAFKSGTIGGFTLSNGVLSSMTQAYILPDNYVLEDMKWHILDKEPYTTKYDFNSDGVIDSFDMVSAKNYRDGIETKEDFENWQYAELSEVNFTINPSDPSKAISITATDMWGRARNTYIGIDGIETSKVTAVDLIAGKSLVVKDDSQTVFAIGIDPYDDNAVLNKGLSIVGDLTVKGSIKSNGGLEIDTLFEETYVTQYTLYALSNWTGYRWLVFKHRWYESDLGYHTRFVTVPRTLIGTGDQYLINLDGISESTNYYNLLRLYMAGEESMFVLSTTESNGWYFNFLTIYGVN